MDSGRVYKTNFWKDGVWLLLLVAGIPGFVILLVCLVGFIFTAAGFAGSTIDGMNFAIWVVFYFLIFFSGYVLFYAFWGHYRNKIIFGQDEIGYVYPNFLFLVKDTEQKISYSQIIGIVLGWHAMEKAFPEKIEECKPFFGTMREITIQVSYEESGKTKMLTLSIIHKKEYYEEFSRLIKSLDLKAKEIPFAFKRQQ
ncbi:MAG: hypothetical protein NTZ73_03495 [Candidatus Diapherotrites archaeon]|nr:hypothetical protein [Candidatus Diapherotrites archaeon]